MTAIISAAAPVRSTRTKVPPVPFASLVGVVAVRRHATSTDALADAVVTIDGFN
jgi:hypothetical protein